MGATLTIRLDDHDRKILEAEARRRSIGLSAFIRDLAEAEARHLARAAIRAEGERVTAYMAAHPQAQQEIDEYGTPASDLP